MAEEHQWMATVPHSHLKQLCLSGRHAAVVGCWTIAVIGVVALTQGPLQPAILLCTLFWFVYWPLLISASITPASRDRTALIVIDSSGALIAQWGLIKHRWSPGKWRKESNHGGTTLIVRWPWCLFGGYSRFPGPQE